MVNAMRITGAISAALISTAGLAYADLDLTPRSQEYELEGTKLHQLVFTDGEKPITYAPPRNWTYSGTVNRFVLHPATGAAAEAEITSRKLAGAQSFDEATIKRLIDEVLTSIPQGASGITLVSQQLNPLLIDRKETLLVVIGYDYYGQSYERSVMFLNRKNNEQIRFQLTCYRTVFRKLQREFEGSHYSWQNL